MPGLRAAFPLTGSAYERYIWFGIENQYQTARGDELKVKKRNVIIGLLALAAAAGCSDSSTIDAEQARTAAIGLLAGGTAGEALRVEEDGFDLWQVEVAMPNAASLEVLVFADDGALFEIKDDAGPFDYDELDPLPGALTYAEARAVALERVPGSQEVWEVKLDEGRYFYEFYLREDIGQLWEVKLWADSGEIFTLAAKDSPD